MLQVEDLHVRYGTTHAVRGIDLHLDVGQPLAMIGANGAGKTSTLRAISGLEPSAGRRRFDGEDLRGLAPHEIARRGLIQVPEGRHIFADLTVHENILMGTAAARGRRPAFAVDDVYELFPALPPLRHRLGYALSGGEQQMVAIGRALVGAPRVLLVDEPSLGLAPLVADAVADALAEIASATAMLLVEQNVHMALRTCPRAVVVVGGEVVLEASATELHDRDDLLASYLGQGSVGTGA